MSLTPPSWLRMDAAKLLTDPGFSGALREAEPYRAMWVLAFYSWQRGLIPKANAHTLGTCSPATVDRLVELGALVSEDAGYRIAWLEEMRTEAAEFTQAKAEAGRKGGLAKASNARQSLAGPSQTYGRTDVQSESDSVPTGSTPTVRAVLRHAAPLFGKDPPPRARADKPGTPQAELVLWWCECWQFHRESAYAPQTKDFVAAAKLLKLAPLAEIQKRADRMLGSEDSFYLRAADLSLLAGTAWNKLTGPPGLNGKVLHK